MSEPKWTPGPWSTGYNGGVTGSGSCYHEWREELKCPVVYSGQGEYSARNPRPIILISAPRVIHNSVVAHVIPEPDRVRGDTNGEANARLIASAPELYAVLERIIDATHNAAIARGEESMAVRLARIHATAVLAKARGEA